MNHKNRPKVLEIHKKEIGYTLIEVIIAIAICSFGLVTILSLYGISLQTKMVSENVFAQSLEINSISDEIHSALSDTTLITLSDKVEWVLQKYPKYTLEEINTNNQSGLYTIRISQKSIQSQRKNFWIKLFWRSS